MTHSSPTRRASDLANLGADVVDNDQVRIRDLPVPLQDMLLNLQVGEASPPFGSVKDGVRVLVLCGRDDPQNAGAPSFEQIMTQLEDERVNKRARIYLLDLRRDRAEEHTSELQSLMRISSACFCLKTKT